MKVGVILCAWQTEEYVEASLAPWIAARETRLGGHDYVICAVSVPFEGFAQSEPRDRTRAILGAAVQADNIDHVIVTDKPMKETEARGRALQWLIERGVDVLWQWDADEIGTAEQIAAIAGFVAARPQVPWFRVCYRNYVFDQQTYLVDPFTPPRIHRVAAGELRATDFYDDNNVLYRRPGDGWIVRDTDLPCVTIPKAVAWIKHLTWLSDLRSKTKAAYQWVRWGRCDFDWDDSRGGLIWRDGQPIPETATG